MSAIFPDFWHPPPLPLSILTVFLILSTCWQLWPIFDPSPLPIADVVYWRPQRATNVLRKIYSCVEAYDFSNINKHSNEYNLCTEKISVSNNKIHKILTEIEIFAAPQSQSSGLPIRIQLGTINNIERNKTTVGPRGTSCGTLLDLQGRSLYGTPHWTPRETPPWDPPWEPPL